MLNANERAEVTARIKELVARLDRGMVRIDQAQGAERARLEAFWVGLLGEYEVAYDALHGAV